jgi:hypothetical protein
MFKIKEKKMTTEIRTINVEKSNVDTANSRWNWLYKLSSAAALGAGILFLVAIIDLILAVFQPGAKIGGVSLFQNNWLIVIFKLHAGFSGVHIDLLHALNYLDIAILAIVSTVYLGLYAALRRTSQIWSIIAVIQPFLGIVLFITTKNAGRSGIMGAALVISVVMLRSNIFNKVTAYMGILASVLLLVGDFSAGAIPPLAIIATLFGIGYVCLIIWFFRVARRLFQLDRASVEVQNEPE